MKLEESSRQGNWQWFLPLHFQIYRICPLNMEAGFNNVRKKVCLYCFFTEFDFHKNKTKQQQKKQQQQTEKGFWCPKYLYSSSAIFMIWDAWLWILIISYVTLGQLLIILYHVNIEIIYYFVVSIRAGLICQVIWILWTLSIQIVFANIIRLLV